MPNHNTMPVNQIIAINQTKGCKVCGEPRYRLSGYCHPHTRVMNYWGDGRARPIHRKEYQSEREEVEELLKLNLGHTAINHALNFLQGLLDKAAKGIPQVPGSDHLLSTVSDRGATARELFVEVTALQLLYWRSDRKIKSKKHLVNLTGNKVLRIKRTSERIGGRNNRMVGQFVIDGIGPVLLLNVARACDKRLELEQDWLKEQGEELHIR